MMGDDEMGWVVMEPTMDAVRAASWDKRAACTSARRDRTLSLAVRTRVVMRVGRREARCPHPIDTAGEGEEAGEGRG